MGVLYVDDDPDDIGTVRWFGESWGAPVCDPRAHVDTPVGSVCPRCNGAIGPANQGIGVPDGTTGTYLWWDLVCWFDSLGLSADGRLLESPLPPTPQNPP